MAATVIGKSLVQFTANDGPVTAICEICTEAELGLTRETAEFVVWPTETEPNATAVDDACRAPVLAFVFSEPLNAAPPQADKKSRRHPNGISGRNARDRSC